MGILGKAYRIAKNIYADRYVKNWYRGKNQPAHDYLKKRPMPELARNDMDEIDAYWKQYGIRIRDYSWFQWYYGVTGEKNPRFIPQDIYSCIVWPYYDNEEFQWAWTDKNYFERFLPDLNFPAVVLRKVAGNYYDGEWNYYDANEKEKLVEVLMSHSSVIAKDAIDSGEGRGVKKYVLNDKSDALRLLNDWKSDNFLVQEVVQQADYLSQFNEDSLNVIRINSFLSEGKVEILNSTLRVGTPGFVTDVAYIDGEEIANVIGINSDGTFKPEMLNQHGTKTEPLQMSSGGGVYVWGKLIETVKSAHIKLAHFGIIGWDFTVTKNGEIVCIEYNVRKPGTVFYQYVNGPFFGDYTDKILSFLRDKKNQDYYIPDWMRTTKRSKGIKKYIPLFIR